MVEYEIKNLKGELEINITKIKENKEKILENFNYCKEGNCSCPTDQYTKVKNLEIMDEADKITINLKPKDIEKFDEKEIEKCVDFTVKDI